MYSYDYNIELYTYENKRQNNGENYLFENKNF